MEFHLQCWPTQAFYKRVNSCNVRRNAHQVVILNNGSNFRHAPLYPSLVVSNDVAVSETAKSENLGKA